MPRPRGLLAALFLFRGSCVFFFFLVFFVAAVAGCSTSNSFSAEVALPGPVGGLCMLAALDSEQDVHDLVRTGQDSVAFRLALPGVKPKHRPSFALALERDVDGAPLLTLSTRYETGTFASDRSAGDPSAALERATGLAGQVTESCTGHAPTFGDTRPCGTEVEDLCVRGR
jgi:hypothetical protein